MIEVRVPATSANVGPGFDCMGIALSLYGTFRFRRLNEGLIIRGCLPQWQNEQNLVYQGFQRVFQRLRLPLTGLALEICADAIPSTRGMGSSAACIVAGVMGANALCGNRLGREEMAEICAELEGHPDNVVPALYGGMTIAFTEAEKLVVMASPVDKKFKFCAMIPDYPLLTEAARRVLPDHLSYADAVYNIGRSSALVWALSNGDSDMVAKSCNDRLHQPYRKELILDYPDIQALCRKHGALACYISGSGSTMMAISDDEDKLAALKDEVSARYQNWQVHCLRVDDGGAQVSEVDDE